MNLAVAAEALSRIRELSKEQHPERLDDVAREIWKIADDARRELRADTLDQKAAAILVEGRLRVRTIRADGLVVAHVVGRTGEYDLGFDPAKREWRCTCPVLGRQSCSHLTALRLVVEPRAPARRDDDDHDDEGRTDASHPG